MSNAYEHMEEAWGFEQNPFPQAAISSGSTEPYSPEVFPARDTRVPDQGDPRRPAGRQPDGVPLEPGPRWRHRLRQDRADAPHGE